MMSQREQELLSENLISELNQIAQGNFGYDQEQKVCEVCERTLTEQLFNDKCQQLGVIE